MYLINLDNRTTGNVRNLARHMRHLCKDLCKPVWLGANYKIPAKYLGGLVCFALFVIPIASSKAT